MTMPTTAGGALPTLKCNKVSEQVPCVQCLKCDHDVKQVVKTINFNRSKALHQRQFIGLLLHIEVDCGDVIYPNDMQSLFLHWSSSQGEILHISAGKGQPMSELLAQQSIWMD